MMEENYLFEIDSVLVIERFSLLSISGEEGLLFDFDCCCDDDDDDCGGDCGVVVVSVVGLFERQEPILKNL